MSSPSLAGTRVDRVDVEAILAAVRESVATAIAMHMREITEGMSARLDATKDEVRHVNRKIESLFESRGIGSSSFRSAARSDPGLAHWAKSPFAENKRYARKDKSRSRHAQTLYQLNALLFDEILKSRSLVKNESDDTQDRGLGLRTNSAQNSTGPGRVRAQIRAIDEAHEVSAESSEAPMFSPMQETPVAVRRNSANDSDLCEGLPVTLRDDEQEQAVDIPGAPDRSPPLMPVAPVMPVSTIKQPTAPTSDDCGNGSMQSKPASRVRREATEAIVSKATRSLESKVIEEEEAASLVPFANCYFGKAHLLRATLLLSCFAGLGVRVPMGIAFSPQVHFLRECSLILSTAAAVVGSCMMKDASDVTSKMMKWGSAHGLSNTWPKVALACRRRSFRSWLLMLACALLIEVLILHPEGMKSVNLQTQAEMTLFIVGEVLSLFAFVVASYLLVCSASIQAHMLIGLDLFIDRWCADLLDDADFEDGVSSWNTVQAFIRRVGNAIDNSLSAVLMGAFLGCGTVAVRAIAFGMQPNLSWSLLVEMCSSLPMLLLVVLAGMALLQSSGITEKCAILPSLINQINSHDESSIMDLERQYLVCYLTDSPAGIYVKGVKLTMTIVVKIVHSFGVGLFAVLGLAVRMSH
eukprot:TRINITY_DN17203_c0_g1_i6.p1 TRINITY_DN17203_c0_g1~~TRINITY_DN17203_c0_g1_i6.p1  ORF type:complete len:638 (+),score=76.35 TRINITY_DN17203_c0_g1_i6:55-1968(+)